MRRSNRSRSAPILVLFAFPMLSVAVVLSSCSTSEPSGPLGTVTPVSIELGKPAPDFGLPGLDGNEIRLSDLKGKMVYVDFWASWCGPCVALLPGLKQTWADYRDKDFVILSISLDVNETVWQKYVEENELDWTHVYEKTNSSNRATTLYGVETIPNTFLVDKDGVVVGLNVHGELLRQALEAYLD